MNIEKELLDRVVKFMIDNGIKCSDTIYQKDQVIENAYEFLDDLFKIVDPRLPAWFVYGDE